MSRISGVMRLSILTLPFILGLYLDSASALPGKQPEPVGETLIPRDVPQDRILNIDNVKLPGINSTIGNSDTVAPVDNLTIILAPPIKDKSTSFSDAHAESLQESLPDLLKKLGVDAADIPELLSEGIPLLKAVAIATIEHQNTAGNDTATLVARGVFGDIAKWVKKVARKAKNVIKDATVDAGCGVFAAAALDGYLLAADSFAVQNVFKSPRSTTPDQDFYIFPLHGPISHHDNIKIYYNANFAPGFGSADGVTMGHNIYLRRGPSTKQTDAGFNSVTKLLLHEFTHSKQYQALYYNLHAFGLKYLFEYCKAGFDYKKDKLEVEAYTKQEYMNDLFGFPGGQFIAAWAKRGGQKTFGLPTARTYLSLGAGRYRLPMQKGSLAITCRGGACS